MRAVLQRVTQAQVDVNGETKGAIRSGILVLLGISRTDTEADADFLVGKIANLRIFDDSDGKLNLSVTDIGGSLLVVSQFTLYGDCRRGRRPSYDEAAPGPQARLLYEYFVARAREHLHVETGVFQASMSVRLTNDGPVTLICESARIGTRNQ